TSFYPPDSNVSFLFPPVPSIFIPNTLFYKTSASIDEKREYQLLYSGMGPRIINHLLHWACDPEVIDFLQKM
ncbi:MAG: hypothetical protein PUC17_02110, partial [Anaerostipes sp.]|nr:hypothetical protein [Anaerostipes sp.]